MTESAKLPLVYFDLMSVDSNAYSLMGNWAKAARKAMWPKQEIDRVLDEAKKSDYDHLILTLQDNSSDPPLRESDVDIEGDDDSDDDIG